MLRRKTKVQITEPSDIHVGSSDNAKKKLTKSQISQRLQFQIKHEGKDVTPATLHDDRFVKICSEGSHSLDVLTGFRNRLPGASYRHLRKAKKKQSIIVKVSSMAVDLSTISVDPKEQDEDLVAQQVTSYDTPKVMKYPERFSATLRETESFTLFELPSLTSEKGTEEGDAIEENNERYAYLTEGKGCNRKVIDAGVQTHVRLLQTRATIAPRIDLRNNYASASAWDMHHTYESLTHPEAKETKDDTVLYMAPSVQYLRKPKSADPSTASNLFDKLVLNERFFDSVVLTQRILAYNIYRYKQEKFREGAETDPLSLEIEYKYHLQPLWKFSTDKTSNKAVTSVSRNHKSPYLYAVSYGKFNYSETTDGLICIWCVKNPEQPERSYSFDEPITTVTFSKQNPHWLAVGFYNGDVLILDVTTNDKTVLGFCSNMQSQTFEPIWCAKWLQKDDRTEYIMTCGQNGRINKYTRIESHDFPCAQMMTITRTAENVRGVYKNRLCPPYDIPIVRNPACLILCPHPRLSDIYYVGTEDGSLHKCSTNYLNQHIGVFQAHNGAVYDMSFSKFCPKVFATCGADGSVRIWAEDINSPLVTLTSDFGGAMQALAWSPNNSTIIAAVNGDAVYIWDLKVKVYKYCSKTIIPGATLTFITFTKSKDVLIIGDRNGDIHLFTLNEVSIPAYYQGRQLERSIRKSLKTYPELLKQLDKVGKLYE